MKKSIKKGFTLVELLVVIAIIAILSIVGIVGYVSFTNRARVSNDTTIVTELNRVLQAEHVNKKPSTMQDVVDEIFDAGFDLTKLTPTAAKHHIVYDFAKDRFYLLNESYEVVGGELDGNPLTGKAWDHWKVIQNYSEVSDDHFSHYLGKMKDTEGEGLTTSTGIDVGSNTVAQINYTGGSVGKEVVIRTNGGTLTIDAKNDTVDHYGRAEKVDVIAVANASYHENGTVQLIAVKEGHVKLESEADVNGIYVYNNSNGEIKDNSFKDIKITVTQGVDVPKLSRSAVEIASTGTKVCTVVTDQAKDVYLFNEGIYEQIKTVDAGKPISDTSVAWADSSANTANTQAAAQQLANEWSGEVAPTWSSNDKTRKLEDITNIEEALGVDADATAQEIAQAIENNVEEGGKTAEQAKASSALKGSGTQADPFLVYDYETMQKISDFYNVGYYYFAVDMSKTDNGKIDCLNTWAAVKINGSFDGKGVKFINLDWRLFQNIQKDSYIKNLDIVNCNIRNTGSIAALANYFYGNTLIENVNISGYIEGQGQTAGYASYCSDGTALITFKDCTSTAKIVAIGGQAGGFMVNPYALANKTGENIGFVIDNSYIEGQLYSTTNDTGYADSKAYCAYVYAHTIKVPVQFKNIDPDKESLCVNSGSNPSHNNIYWLTNDRSHLITVANPSLDLSGVAFGSTFSLNVSNDVAYATISLLISPNGPDNTGSYTSTYLTETVNSKDGVITSDIVKKYNVAINGSIDGTTMNQVETSETGIANDGITYNVLNNSYGYTHNGVNIFIVLYSANGDVLAYTNTQYISKTGN